MSELDDRQLDSLLSGHFAAQLDPHAGRCARAFEQYALPQRRNHALAWAFALAAGAAAACLVIVWSHHHRVQPRPGIAAPTSEPSSEQIAKATQSQPPFVERAFSLQNVNEGTFMMRDVPVRQVRQVLLENVRWYDPEKRAEVQMTIPRERVIFIEMETY